MKKSSVNTFTEGLVCDLDPINVPNNVLTDCLNGTIITYDGNEYSLQNDKGNYPLTHCKLHPNYIPVGIKEYGGIIYIASINPLTGDEQLGCYPSPKKYSGNTDGSEIDFDFTIQKSFEELGLTKIDYDVIESRLKTEYYSAPELKINVGDEFWFNDTDINSPFEKIERYIIDENANEHLVSDDWYHNSKYISPVSGTMFLKNKIFKIDDSSIESNSFFKWKVNHSKYVKITSCLEDWSGKYIIGYHSSSTISALSSTNGVVLVEDNCVSVASGEHLELEVSKNSDGSYYIKHSGLYLKMGNTITGSGGNAQINYIWSNSIDENDDNYKWLIEEHVSEYGSRTVFYSYDKAYHFTAGTPVTLLTTRALGGPPVVSFFKKEEYPGSETLLFSFTYKLYIEDEETAEWLKDVSKLAYELVIKKNNKIIYSEIKSDFNDSLEESTVTSTNALRLEWFNNSKIISKYFSCTFQDIVANDIIDIEITPILNYESEKQIVISRLTKKLNNSISDYITQSWSIGKSKYKFYNHPTNGNYDRQYIELDVEGPIEANDDVYIKCEIHDLNGQLVTTKLIKSGIGRVILSIPYSTSFEKENVYSVIYSAVVSNQVACQVEKRLITSQVFNYDSLLSEYDHYDLIKGDKIFELYLKTLSSSVLYCTVDYNNSFNPSTTTKMNYLTGSTYFDEDVLYSSFITDSNYYNNDSDEILAIKKYDTKIDVKPMITLTGKMWTISEDIYIKDGIGAAQKYSPSKSNYWIPIGYGQRFSMLTEPAILGRIESVEEIQPSREANIKVKSGDATGAARIEFWSEESLVKYYYLNPQWSGQNSRNISSDISEFFDYVFKGDVVNLNITTDLSYYSSSQHGTLILEPVLDINGGTAAKSSAGGYYVLDIPHYTVNCVNNKEKYTKGMWCQVRDLGSSSEINTITSEHRISVRIAGFDSFSTTKSNSETVQIKDPNNASELIGQINDKMLSDKQTFNAWTTMYPGIVKEGDFVKGVIVKASTGDNYQYNCLSKNYRETNKFMFPSPYTPYASKISLHTVKSPGNSISSSDPQDIISFIWKEEFVDNRCTPTE